MPRDDSLAAVMLTHAAITYRGFARPAASARDLRRAMTELLDRLGPVRGEWDLIWGPAGFRADVDPFDDAAMYVARHSRRPSQVVVAIRGTNPISLFDWVFGDLMVRRQVPWPYAPPTDGADARSSMAKSRWHWPSPSQ